MTKSNLTRSIALSIVVLICTITNSAYGQTASFTLSSTGGCSPLIVNFDGNASSGSGTLTYNWDFGNGNTTSGTQFSNSSAIYTSAGTYTVSLTVTDDNGTSAPSSGLVTVFQNPTASFSFTGESTGCVTQTIDFADGSSAGDGTINQWTWDFGDGQGSSDQTPTHDYGTAGSFAVTLIVSDDNGCQDDTATGNIFSFTQPFTSDFDVSAPNNTLGTCESTLTVDFQSEADTNAASGPFSYAWDFGDGASSTSSSPSHQYTEHGRYDVQFTVTDASSGCSVITTKNNYVKLQDFGAGFTAIPTSGCNPLTVSFNNVSDSLAANQTVTWDLGDGTTIVGTGVSPEVLSFSHTYTTPGSYVPSLLIDDGSCSSEFTPEAWAIQLTDPVSGTITVDNEISCDIPHVANFSVSIDDAQSYIWNFGDGSSSTDQSPTHSYTDYGEYTVTVITSDTANCSSVSTATSIVNVQLPTADFSDDLLDQVIEPSFWNNDNELLKGGCVPITVNFTDNSSSESPITNWQWDFGDGNSSGDQNPSNTYTQRGEYDVTLIVTDNSGCQDTLVCEGCIEAGVQPDAQLNESGFPKQLCCNVEQLFVNETDLDEADIFHFYNNLGDSFTGSSSGTHDWDYLADIPGEEDSTIIISTTMIAYDNGCADTFNLENWGELHTPYVEPVVIYDPCVFTPTFTVDSLISVGLVDHYDWVFEHNNQTSTDQEPTFDSPTESGSFSLTLTTYDSTNSWNLPLFKTFCTCEISTDLYFLGNPSNREFSASDTIGCSPLAVDFAGPQLDVLVAWDWDFGDGTTGSGENVSHTYSTPGVYDVRLITTDFGGCLDTILETSYITAEGPHVIVDAPTSVGCAPLTISADDNSVLNAPLTTRTWSFDDGSATESGSSINHTWSTPPSLPTLQSEGYKLILTLEDTKGCSSADTVNVIVAEPAPEFEEVISQRCSTDYFVFIPSISDTTGIGPFEYNWSFPDGSPASSADSIASTELPDGGPYSVNLTLTDIHGCTGTGTVEYTIDAAQPVPAFQASPTIGTCPPVVVSFTDTSVIGRSPITDWAWTFGNGSQASLQSPTNIYSTQETFTVALSVTDSLGCTVVTAFQDHITITGVTGSIETGQDSVCQDSSVMFIAVSPNAANYAWDMRDGTVVQNDTVVHAYASTGTRFPLLVMQDSTGLCSSEFTDTVVVLGPPSFDLGDDNHFCSGDSLTISVGVTGQSYLWSTNETSESITVSDSGLYTVRVTSPDGCPDLDSITISEAVLPILDLESPTLVCKGVPTEVTAASADSIVSYSWMRIDSIVGSNATISATETEAITYYITVADTNNCTTLDSTIFMPIVEPLLSFDNPGGCLGGSYILTATADTSATNELYIWSKNGTTIDTSSSILVDQTGAYDLRYLLGSCPADSSIDALFFDLPPTEDREFEFCDETEGTATLDAGDGYTAYSWTNSGETSQTIIISEYGSYPVVVIDTNNCSKESTIEVVEGCDLRFYSGNAFTPNGDGTNDIYLAKGAYLVEFTMSIFNKWGEVIFFSDDITTGWDGTYRGRDMPGGTYTVVFTYAADGQDEATVINHKIALIR